MNSEEKDVKQFLVGSSFLTCSKKRVLGVVTKKIYQAYTVDSVDNLEKSEGSFNDLPILFEGDEFFTKDDTERCKWIVRQDLTPEISSRERFNIRDSSLGNFSLPSQERLIQLCLIFVIILPCVALLNFAVSTSGTIVPFVKMPLYLLAAGAVLGGLYLVARSANRPFLADGILKLGAITLIASLFIPFALTSLVVVIAICIFIFIYLATRVVDNGPEAIAQDILVIQEQLRTRNYRSVLPFVTYNTDAKQISPSRQSIDAEADSSDKLFPPES